MSGRFKNALQLGANTVNGSFAAMSIATTSDSNEKHASPTPTCFDSEYSPGVSMVSPSA